MYVLTFTGRCHAHVELKIAAIVLNPYMRDTWMNQFWEVQYIEKAKADILGEVSIRYDPIHSIL